MPQDQVQVRFARQGGRACLRELSGREERSVGDASTFTAIRLLDALLVAAPGVVLRPGQAGELTAADRDRLLAAVHRRAFGDKIESTVHCARCGNPFDLSFSLEELEASLDSQSAPEGVERDAEGSFRSAGGGRFRLPSGHEECEAALAGPGEGERVLFERCVIEPAASLTPESLGEACERVAPVLDLDLDARCPECGRFQSVHFDIQSYLLGSLMRERRKLASEVHRLAACYGWSLADILALERGERRMYVEMAEAEMARRPRAYA